MKKLLGIMVLGLLSSLILSSCRPKVDILDLSTVDQKILTEASKGKIFWIYKFVINRSAVRLRAGAPSP